MAKNFVDPYLDANTGILRNLVGATTIDKLCEAEADSAMSGEIDLSDIPRTNDLSELCAIHRALFGKIYDWAGEIRTVDIRKNVDGSQFFLIVSRISMGSDYVFNKLASENYLKGLTRAEFVSRLAYFFDQLNYIHPFREGNGRAQRAFWGRVARDAGYRIDWSKTTRAENDEASRLAAEKLDLSQLETMFDKIVEPLT